MRPNGQWLYQAVYELQGSCGTWKERSGTVPLAVSCQLSADNLHRVGEPGAEGLGDDLGLFGELVLCSEPVTGLGERTG